MSTRSPSPRLPFAPGRGAVTSALGAIALMMLGTFSAPPAQAQSDEQAVITVVNHFFDGMRTRDTALLRSTSVPSTVLQTAGGPDGVSAPMPIDQFIQRIGKGTGPGGTEVIKDPKVQSDGSMASLWAYFTYTRGGETQINHCGIDEFLLRKGPDGWKVFYVADTHRTQGCAPITK